MSKRTDKIFFTEQFLTKYGITPDDDLLSAVADNTAELISLLYDADDELTPPDGLTFIETDELEDLKARATFQDERYETLRAALEEILENN